MWSGARTDLAHACHLLKAGHWQSPACRLHLDLGREEAHTVASGFVLRKPRDSKQRAEILNPYHRDVPVGVKVTRKVPEMQASSPRAVLHPNRLETGWNRRFENGGGQPLSNR